MKLEEGMYFRRIGINKINTFIEFNKDEYRINGFYINKKEIKKASHNIIDLIEEGDYVNGYKIVGIGELSNGTKVLDYYEKLNNSVYYLLNEDIETIVTKEQFASMQYEVK